MKARSEIMGLCIVNIQTAAEIGKIRDVLLDPADKGIAYYVLAEPSDYFGARLINQKHVVGLGGFALTVTGEKIIEDVAHCPKAIELLNGGIQAIGTHALSDKGVLLGTVRQIFFDETTGAIVRYRIENEEGHGFDIDGVDVVTLGSNFTIFLDDSMLIDIEEVEAVSFGKYPSVADSACGEDGAQASSPDEREEQFKQDPYEELSDAHGEQDEYGGQMSQETSEDMLKVSARPLSAAEMALVKAAESLRQKYAAEAMKGQRTDVAENHTTAAPAGSSYAQAKSSYYSVEPVSAQAAASRAGKLDRVDRPDRTMGTARSEITERPKKMDGTNRMSGTDRADRTDKLGGKGPSGWIENKDSLDKTERIDQASLPRSRNSDGAKTTVLNFSPGQDKGSLSAAELIYPKDFNLFDRRQMQFLLGKRLAQAVQLESGEIMEEGEYISAEMLSRVRSRHTLMELTAHVRKA